MIYRLLKDLVLFAFRAPMEPPPAPAGAHGSVEVFRASPRYLTYRMIWLLVGVFFVFVGFAGGAVAAVATESPGPLVLGVAIAFLSLFAIFISYFLIHLDYDLRYYVLTDRSLRVRQGAWTVKEMTLTYANVQNLRVVQGPVQAPVRHPRPAGRHGWRWRSGGARPRWGPRTQTSPSPVSRTRTRSGTRSSHT